MRRYLLLERAPALGKKLLAICLNKGEGQGDQFGQNMLRNEEGIRNILKKKVVLKNSQFLFGAFREN